MYEDDLYPLFLAGDKCLKTGCHSESELVNEGWLVLTVDLNFDPSFKRRLICRNSKNEGSQQHTSTFFLSPMNPDTRVHVSDFFTLRY